MIYEDKLYEQVDKSIYEDGFINDEMIKYEPILDKVNKQNFDNIVDKIKDLKTVDKIYEIDKILDSCEESKLNNIEEIKYIVSLRILKDLLVQGWSINKTKNIFLCSPNLNMNDKDALRLRLYSEKKSQFKVENNKKFINRMETEKTYKKENISIKNLIGNSTELLNKIERVKNGEEIDIVDPYIQLVEHGKIDEFSGYKLNDIWRYFRYTWSIPYKNSPGRNLFYLVRDRSQPYHPVIGIAALGNCVLNLSVRDNYIGWTFEEIKEQIENVHNNSNFNDIEEYSYELYNRLNRFISEDINEIYYKDLIDEEIIENPTNDNIRVLKNIYDELKDKHINLKKNIGEIDYKEETQSILYKKKRAKALYELLDAKRIIIENSKQYELFTDKLKAMIEDEQGKKAINIALKANRKKKIGSNLMEIIVCGAIPPYTNLLGGKLVSSLIVSPKVIHDYNIRYESQVSEIASRMKGEEVVRDSRLVYLGTTSLYSVGSSQYNRINIPIDGFDLRYKKIGLTEGYGSVFFSKETTSIIDKMLNIIDNGRKINNVFGEGTSPRMRLIVNGLSAIGINSRELLNHHSPRIVYGIELARNTREFLNGSTNYVDYYFGDSSYLEEKTDEIIEFWKKRWLNKRIYNIEIENILAEFSKESIMLSNEF